MPALITFGRILFAVLFLYSDRVVQEKLDLFRESKERA